MAATPRLRRRLASALYESLLCFALVFIGGYLFSTLTQSSHGLQNRHPIMAVVFVVLGVYFTGLWRHGQTLPMKTWRIRVVDRLGQPLSWSRAFLRYLMAWLWFLPPLALGSWVLHTPVQQTLMLCGGWFVAWALMSRWMPDRQYPHDVLAGTRLIQSTA